VPGGRERAGRLPHRDKCSPAPAVYADFLDKHGEGRRHVLVDWDGAAWDERLRLFGAHGYRMTQSGVWMGRVPFAYFATEDDTTATIETASFPDDLTLAEPDQWYPAPPPARPPRRARCTAARQAKTTPCHPARPMPEQPPAASAPGHQPGG
jgi:hypothetical protein